MKKRILALLMCIAMALAGTALASEDGISIVDSFDVTDWSFGEIDWLTPIDEYMMTFTDGGKAELVWLDKDATIKRREYVKELGCECDVIYLYSSVGSDNRYKLVQIEIRATAEDEAGYLKLVDGAQAAFDAISAAYGDANEINVMYDNQGIFERMRAHDEQYDRAFWSDTSAIAELDGKDLAGIMSADYEYGDSGMAVGFTFGATITKGK